MHMGRALSAPAAASCEALSARKGHSGVTGAGAGSAWADRFSLLGRSPSYALPVCPADAGGAESLACAVRAATGFDARATVLSIDGVGASLTALLPFVAQFYASSEHAYLDDMYVTSQPERAGPAFTALGTALWECANIRIHLGRRGHAMLRFKKKKKKKTLPAAARHQPSRPSSPGHAAAACRVHLGSFAEREKHDDLLGRIPDGPSRTYRAPGSSCSFARSLGTITCFACCGPLTRTSSLSPTTGPLPAAWGACFAGRPSHANLPSSRLGVRSSYSGMRSTQAAAYWVGLVRHAFDAGGGPG